MDRRFESSHGYPDGKDEQSILRENLERLMLEVLTRGSMPGGEFLSETDRGVTFRLTLERLETDLWEPCKKCGGSGTISYRTEGKAS
jgi:hypothetical protein